MIITWHVLDLMQALGMGFDQHVTGVKLSLDGHIIQFRVVPYKVVGQLLNTLMEGGSDGLPCKV